MTRGILALEEQKIYLAFSTWYSSTNLIQGLTNPDLKEGPLAKKIPLISGKEPESKSYKVTRTWGGKAKY